MAAERKAMQCPACGSAMNHHSVKLIYATRAGRRRTMEAELVERLEEIHTCPGCGKTESRPEDETRG